MMQAAGLYGGSMFELAVEEHIEEKLLGQIKWLMDIFEKNSEYIHLLQEPAIPIKKRKELLDQALGGTVDRYLLNFMKILCERNLLGHLKGCMEEYVLRYNQKNGVLEGKVISAFPLSDEKVQVLENHFSKITGKKVVLHQKTDPGVLAGIRIELDGKAYDNTVAGRMSDLTKKLKGDKGEWMQN